MARTLVVIPTYNEIENLPLLVDEILAVAPDVQFLVVDDASPDGTGEWCRQRAERDERFACLLRPAKLGLGTAAVAGFRYALEHGYDYVVTMDADFSHHPRYLPQLRGGLDPPAGCQLDVIIGSRYVHGGGVEGWPLYRRLMSRAVNRFARTVLGLQVKDCSGAFRCYRGEILRQLDLDELRSQGYSYLEEILWRLSNCGAKFGEIPILFTDRQRGRTKIDLREAVRSVGMILRLGLARLCRS